MTKKDYIVIAEVIKSETEIWRKAYNKWTAKDDGKLGAKTCLQLIANNKVIAEALCHELAKDNDRFDRGRFLTACGFEN